MFLFKLQIATATRSYEMRQLQFVQDMLEELRDNVQYLNRIFSQKSENFRFLEQIKGRIAVSVILSTLTKGIKRREALYEQHLLRHSR